MAHGPYLRAPVQMKLLKSVETTIANLLEGAFGRMFRSEVRPVELARGPRPAAARAGGGETMVSGPPGRVGGPGREAPARRQAPRAILAVGPRRLLVPPAGGTVGRSRDCDIVLDDSGVSRRHAEIRPGAQGWTITDLDSTNGVLLNGSSVRAAELHPGDRIELGSTEIVFEVR